jgi:hypothetical protein
MASQLQPYLEGSSIMLKAKCTTDEGGEWVSLFLTFGAVVIAYPMSEADARGVASLPEDPGPDWCGGNWIAWPNGLTLSLPGGFQILHLSKEDAAKIVQAIKDEMLGQDLAALELTHPADGSGAGTLADARRRWEAVREANEAKGEDGR